MFGYQFDWRRWLRLLVVTPEMHRVHHSAVTQELNSNFGFNLPWWDFLFRTYRPEPRDGHEKMHIGLGWLREERQANRLPSMLALPFLVRLPQQNRSQQNQSAK
jgi:sterol desaturase/sphingolipid hydroxylase (fatty acid hydroxylase superfamily)